MSCACFRDKGRLFRYSRARLVTGAFFTTGKDIWHQPLWVTCTLYVPPPSNESKCCPVFLLPVAAALVFVDPSQPAPLASFTSSRPPSHSSPLSSGITYVSTFVYVRIYVCSVPKMCIVCFPHPTTRAPPLHCPAHLSAPCEARVSPEQPALALPVHGMLPLPPFSPLPKPYLLTASPCCLCPCCCYCCCCFYQRHLPEADLLPPGVPDPRARGRRCGTRLPQGARLQGTVS